MKCLYNNFISLCIEHLEEGQISIPDYFFTFCKGSA
jgi:hypothetical protein